MSSHIFGSNSMEIITVALQSIKILVCISQMFHKIHGQSKNATKHFEVVDAGTRNCNFKEMPKI